MLTPSQCNNMFIFPGLGLGASLSGARFITDAIIYETSLALAECVTQEEHARGQVFPDVDRIRDVSMDIAKAVIRKTYADGLSMRGRLVLDRRPVDVNDDDQLSEFVALKMYYPSYVPLADMKYGPKY